MLPRFLIGSTYYHKKLVKMFLNSGCSRGSISRWILLMQVCCCGLWIMSLFWDLCTIAFLRNKILGVAEDSCEIPEFFNVLVNYLPTLFSAPKTYVLLIFW